MARALRTESMRRLDQRRAGYQAARTYRTILPAAISPPARFRYALDADTAQPSSLEPTGSSVDKPSASSFRRPLLSPNEPRPVVFRSLNGELLPVPADCTVVGEARLALTHVLNTYLPFLVLVAMPAGRELQVGDDDVTLASMAATPTITFVSAIVRARSGPLTGAQWVDVLRAHAAVHTADGRGVERALRELYVLGGSGLRQRMLQEALFVEVNKVNDSTETVQELLTMRACPNATDESGVQLPNLNATVDEFARAVHAIDFPEHSVDPGRMCGVRPLLYAAWFGHTRTAEALLEARADVTKVYIFGFY
eukprot:GEMP01056730.1.p1 GENE.GEMP01056730.1~~GEMP01056730.1.p1  ORF type:complete len:328 (+),score=86.76 GEMP01056730.1:56-985(+)